MEQIPNQNEMSDAELGRGMVIEHNLTMMDEDMQKLLNTESIGGNAGVVEIDGKKHSAAGANGYEKPENGEIMMFGNFQDIKDRSITEDNAKFTLRVAMDRPERIKTKNFRGFFKIVDVYLEKNMNPLSPEGEENLRESIKRWNKTH